MYSQWPFSCTIELTSRSLQMQQSRMYPPADDSADVYAPHILDATHSREGSGIRRLFFWWSYSKYPLNRRTFFSSLTMSTCAICTQTEPTLTALTWYVCMPLGIPTHPVLLFVLLCLCIVYRPFAIGHHSLRFLCTKHVHESWSGPISWGSGNTAAHLPTQLTLCQNETEPSECYSLLVNS